MRYPSDVHSIFNIDIIDSLVQQAYKLDGEDKLEIVISKHLDLGKEKVVLALGDHVEEAIELYTFHRLKMQGLMFHLLICLYLMRNFYLPFYRY